MDLAYAAGRAGGTMTGVLSAANEKAVELFIDEKYDSFCILSTSLCFLLDKALHVYCHRLIWFLKYSAIHKVRYVTLIAAIKKKGHWANQSQWTSAAIYF